MRVVLIACLIVGAAQIAAAAGATLPSGTDTADAAVRSDSTGFQSPAKTADQKQLKSEMVRLGLPGIPGMKRWEREKVPKVAMVSSMALPGLGQVYNGRKWKTVIMVTAITWYGANAWFEHKYAVRAEARRDLLPEGSLEWKFQNLLYDFHKESSRDFVWWTGLVWLLGALDAFIDAHLFDVRSIDPTVIQGTDEKFYGVKVNF